MRICLPTLANDGLKSEIAPNFGAAPWLLVVNSDTLETEAFDRTRVEELDLLIRMDLIMCHGMTEWLYDSLRGQGVPIYGTSALTVAEALVHFDEGDLQDLADYACCRGTTCGGEHTAMSAEPA